MVNVQDFWIGLSDFWTSFENRAEIEDFWEGMLEAFKESSGNLHRIYLTQYQKFSPAIWEESYQSFECIVSGAQMNNIQDSNEYYLPSNMVGTFSIPILSGVETGQVFVEGTDFDILGCDRISFGTLPIAGEESDRVTLIAPTSKKIDYSVFNLYRKMADLELLLVDQIYYHPFTFDGDQPATLTDDYKEEKVTLMKFMIWGIMYLKKQIPTISNLKKLYNIFFNLPFAYEGGVISIDGSSCTIGDYTYYISSGSWAFTDGDTVSRFDPLVDGISIYDRINNESLINSTFSELQASCSMVVDVTLQPRSSYLQTFIDDYENKYFSKAMQIGYNVS